MAFEVRKIDPLDLQPRKAVGVNMPFRAKEVFTSNYSTREAIKNNLINFFLTGKGERYLNPLFGTGIRNMLFENITQEKLDEIRTLVDNALEVYFPKVEPKDIQVGSDADKNLVSFYMAYQIKDTGIDDQLLINVAV